MPNYKLTYFDLRGLGEPIRLIFAYAGQSYEDVRISLEPYPLPEERKKEMNLPWGQVPVLEVDGKALSQSRTICMYLGKQFNLLGSNPWDEIKVSEWIDAIQLDFMAKWSPMWSLTDEKAKADLLKKLTEVDTPAFLTKVNQKLKDNGTGFCVGSSATIADIYTANFITDLETTYKVKLAEGFPEIVKLIETVYGLPGIKEYVANRPVTQF